MVAEFIITTANIQSRWFEKKNFQRRCNTMLQSTDCKNNMLLLYMQEKGSAEKSECVEKLNWYSQLHGRCVLHCFNMYIIPATRKSELTKKSV
jgi:hypothetical protein